MRSTTAAWGLFIGLGAGALGAFVAVGGPASPVHIMKGVSAFAPLDQSRVLYREGEAAVMRKADTTTADFDGIYVVNLSNRFDLPQHIDELGDVLEFVPAHFAVMRLEQDKAEEVAARLHMDGHACGILTALDGRPIVTEFLAAPTPIIPVTTRDVTVQRLVALVTKDNIQATILELAAINTRHHRSATGSTVPDLLAEKYETLAAGRNDVTISKYDHGSRTPQDSLVVRIEGTKRADEVIVLGSHLDSITSFGGTNGRSPGADDNASGTATNLEIFRVLMQQGIRLERTLEIHAYAAEEAGLVGSKHIADDYRDRGVNVVAMVQHDMTLYKAAGTPDKIWLVSNSTNAELNDMLGQLISGYVGLPYERATLSGGSSDHASWTRAGFAASFPFENPSAYNRHIHTSNDTTDNATAFDQAAGFAKLGVAYVSHFGGLSD